MENSSARTLTRVFSVIMWVAALFMLVSAAIFTFAFDSVIMEMMNENEEFATEVTGMGGLSAMESMMRIIVFAFILPLAILTIAAGVGVWMQRRWGRILALICSVLFLFSFPVGTAIGVFGIWLFGFNTDTIALFPTQGAPKKKRAAKKR